MPDIQMRIGGVSAGLWNPINPYVTPHSSANQGDCYPLIFTFGSQRVKAGGGTFIIKLITSLCVCTPNSVRLSPVWVQVGIGYELTWVREALGTTSLETQMVIRRF